ncbi:MAG: Type 1 glutamine amidotransferase-like domain-containing protein [Clostridiales bacterium]|nr:Type 1 glutamine amidotransferase-like domain-containing protein [Clostridiales bacterium]
MLLLCSNGLSSENLLKVMSKRAGNCKTAALVVTADNEYKEKNYHVDRCVAELKSLNLHTDILDLDTMPAENLLKYDVVEFIGGNPFYLLNSIREHKAADILKAVADKNVLIGWSAAAFVFGSTLELVNMYSADMNFMGLTDLNGLNLTNIEVLPHYEKFLKQFDAFEEKCRIYEKEHSVEVIRLNDGDGVLIEGNAAEICRGDK